MLKATDKFDTIEHLTQEVQRLKEGRFTPEEFQNLCHNFDGSDQQKFFNGCHEYQKRLLGVSERQLLVSANVAIIELIEQAMQLNMKLGCSCERDELDICLSECDESKVWILLYTARKLLKAQQDLQKS